MTKDDQLKDKESTPFSLNNMKKKTPFPPKASPAPFPHRFPQTQHNFLEEKKTQGGLPTLLMSKEEMLDLDPFATQEELVAVDPSMFPQEGAEGETFVSGATNGHQTNRSWNTRELIHALLPEELAEEIVSSSSNPLFFQQDDGGRSVRDSSSEWSAGTRFFVESPETKESSSEQSLLPTNKSSSPKARELILRCFHEEKDQGLHYVALFEMESRRCLAGLSFDTEGTFEEGTALEHAHVLWNLSRVVSESSQNGELQELMVSMDNRHHMLVPIFSGATVFLYIVFDKDWGTPALMRLYFRQLREELEELLEATFRS